MFLASIFEVQGALLNDIIGYYGLADSAQGLASAAVSAGAAAALVSSFFLIGRLPKLLLLRISVLFCGVFLILLKIAVSFQLFIAIWLLIGIGMGYMDMLITSCMADLYEGRTATRMMCLLHTAYGLMATLAPLIFFALMTGGLAWNSIYICLGIMGAAIFVLLFFTSGSLKGGTERGDSLKEQRMTLRDMGTLLSGGTLPGLMAAVFFQGVFLGGMNTWISRYVGVTLGSALGSASLTAMFLGLMISRLTVPFLPVRPEKYVRTAGIAAGVVLLAALPFQNAYIMCAAVFVCGLAFGALLPCMLSLGCASAPGSTMFATTVLMLALYAGQAITPPVIGAMETAFGLRTGIALCAAAIILCSVSCMTARFPGYGD